MIDYLPLIEADAKALQAAADDAGPDAALPTCPEWRMADLVEHVAGLYHWVETTVRTRADRWISRDELKPWPPLDEALEKVLATLRDTKPDEPVWNWSVNRPKVAAFWPRRMACETAVHRIDAQTALDKVSPVDTALAVDAIEELFDTIGPTASSFRPDMELHGSVHLHATDIEGEWTVSIGGGSIDVVRAHGEASAQVRGTASDLLRWAYSRLPTDSPLLETAGDPAVLKRWGEVVSF